MFNNFYQDKRVLVTGHTGFKGSWLSLWLRQLGAEVTGLSLPAPTQPNLHKVVQRVFANEIHCDLRDLESLSRAIREIGPDIIFHLAAQPLVRLSYAEPIETFQTNALGTANLLESVRRAELSCAVLVITSDKCYENREWEFAYRENDPMGGHDVYSMSKGVAELVVQGWKRSFFLPHPKLGPVATARAGNVIGGGDYALDRIVPDCVRALLAGKPITVRNPSAVRPWQHVLECLSGYLLLGAALTREGKHSRFASPFNFGPEASSQQPVRRLVEEVVRCWPGEWVDASEPGAVHEANLLSLAIEKASVLLGWRPAWDFTTAVRHTIDWYRERHALDNADMFQFTVRQIDAYSAAARSHNLTWAA